MFKLIRNAKGLRTLFNTLISSLPAIANVGSLLFLLMFMYAVLGMNLFGGWGNPFDQAGSTTNFNNFGAALVALFQVGVTTQTLILLPSLRIHVTVVGA